MSDKGPPHSPLWERYCRAQGRVHLTGLQAILRLALDQIRRDRRAGRRVGALFSGYPGSPLAGLDQELRHLRPLLDEEGVRFVPALNEELAASTIGGTQLTEVFAHENWDGVVGFWFGKAPGLDRALDALRHSNFMGSARFGGALALVGDDPFCKSSSLPSSSERAFAHAYVPLLAPADAADLVALGRHAIEISRYAGTWAGLQIVSDVADGGRVFELPEEPADVTRPKFEVMGRRFQANFDTGLLPPRVVEIERDLVFGRMEAARRYAHANGLNPICARHARDSIGLVAAGSLFRELEGALDLLGLGSDELAELGLRVMKMDLVWPVEPRRLCEFAAGLDEIVVVDTRRGFLEEQIRAALYNEVDRPQVVGQRSPTGEPWLARRSQVTATSLALDLSEHLASRLGRPDVARRAEPLRAAWERATRSRLPTRTPHFCSGCPHSTSTRVPEGSAVGGGIGCHTMALLMERGVEYIGAMGSEGAQWIGLEAYADAGHLFQNLGDGTYFHSGRLAVRACVEADVNITFKLLHNQVVAMTGGQHASGAKPLVDLVRDLLSDGVRRVVAMSDDPAVRDLATRDARVSCIDRGGWDRAMRDIREERGVTALIYDELCAHTRQRLQRKGVLESRDSQVWIHEDVCEGCGDCGAKSSCVSLRPVATGLGRKTRIHQSSCSDDRACLDGDCPAFVSVPRPAAADAPPLDLPPLPEPAPTDWRSGRYDMLLVGIGSTGVVTIDALLVRAAEHDGLFVRHLDQTGLAQRGGKVISHCSVTLAPQTGSPRVGWGRADLLLAFDPLGAANGDARGAVDPERTRAVAHALYVPTGAEVSTPGAEPPSPESLLTTLRDDTKTLRSVRAEALAETVLGEARAANIVVLGAALQDGLLPVSRSSLERAIRENGVAVETNLRALELGRAIAVEESLEEQLLADATPPAVGDDGDPAEARALGAAWTRLEEALSAFSDGDRIESLRRRIANLAVDLVDYQDDATARRYLELLRLVAEAEARCAPEAPALTQIAARELYRVIAAKDEYEVARLLLRGPFRRWLERRTGRRPAFRYHLHPPLLRALGLRRKIALGRWSEPLLRGLVAMRRLRGSPLDPFRWLEPRRLEREIRSWYEGLLGTLAAGLTRDNREAALALATRAEELRGYEDVKAERWRRVRAETESALAEWESET
jgi:indolepyruvate ferredoxin oxidoreductase